MWRTRPLTKNCILDFEMEDGRAASMNPSYQCTVSLPSENICFQGVESGCIENKWIFTIFTIHKRYSNTTTLSSYMWHLKSVLSETPDLKWCVLRYVTPYSNISKKCLLSLYKKLEIVTGNSIKTSMNSWTRDLKSSVNVAMPSFF